MEWGKIFYKKEIILFICALFIFQMMVFSKEITHNEDIWDNDRNLTYQNEFHGRVNEILEQAGSMQEISIFSEPGSFSERNAIKTKEDYQRLKQVELRNVSGRTVEAFFSYKTGNVCILICLVLLAFEYSEVNRKRIKEITYTTKNGKMHLALKKNLALLGWSFFINAFFLGGVFFQGLCIFKESPLEILACPAQSFYVFADFPWPAMTWQALAGYLLYRVIILYAIMALVWMTALFLEHIVLIVGSVGAFFILEYFLFKLIDAQHVLSFLRNCNLWYQSVEIEHFTKYMNMNICGFAINRITVIIGASILLIIFSGGIGACLWCSRYPKKSREWHIVIFVRELEKKYQKIIGRFLERLSLTGMEAYKALVVQKGWIPILILAGLLIYRADFRPIQRTEQQELYYSFMEEYVGEPTEASRKEIRKLEENLSEVDKRYNELAENGEEGEIDLVTLIWYESYDAQRAFLEEIQLQTAQIDALKSERGIAAWYINTYSFEHLLECDDIFLNLGIGFAIIWLGIAGYISEKKCGMLPIIGCSKKRASLYKKKVLVSIICTTVLYWLVSVYEIVVSSYVYGLEGIKAPVQSILSLSSIQIHCTIWQYFSLKYIFKYVMFLAITIIVNLIAEYVLCKRGRHDGIKNRRCIKKF